MDTSPPRRSGPVLQRYVPVWVARAAIERPRREQRAARFGAALMIADVSGFTALGERLARSGPQGAETLWRIVNTFFGDTLDLIQAHGGEVIRFAGDAPIVLWPVLEDEDLRTVALRASACGIDLQRRLGVYDTGHDAIVNFRVALAAGDVLAARLGETRVRGEPIVGGNPFEQVARALDSAEVGQVVASPEVAQVCRSLTAERLVGGCLRILDVPDAPMPRATDYPVLSDEALAYCRRYVPRGVIERLDAGHDGWLGELRAVSTLFLSIEGLDYDAEDIDAQLDDLLASLQDAVYRYQGSVNQFLVDDKGTILLAAWGLPGTAHEEGPTRAVLSALALRDALGRHGLTGSVGLSTGKVFCGVKGNDNRAEYGLLGAAVNLAARLMSADQGILVDLATYRAARDQIQFEKVPDLTVKGRALPVRAFRPVAGERHSRRQTEVVGREDLRSQLRQRIAAAVDGEGGVVLLDGQAGMGKSVLLERVRSHAAGAGLGVVSGSADSIERTTPYFALRAMLYDLMRVDMALPPGQRREAVLAWFDAHPALAPLVPLFGPVLSLSFPETPATEQLQDQARAEQTRAAIVAALQTAGPLLVAVEDLHWLDSASWQALRSAMRHLHGVLFVFSSRPEADAPAYHALLEMDPLHLTLEPLGEREIRRVVCNRLQVRSLPAAAEAVIIERAEGHPFYAEELASALHEDGLLTIEDAHCTLAEGADLGGLSLPPTLEGLIAARLDQLAPIELLSLKTGAVVGRSFRCDLLEAIYPLQEQREQVVDALEGVRARHLTRIERPEPELTYLFSHAVTHQVAYEQLLFQQRRELHAAAAAWYEDGNAGPVEPYYPLIAHHWQQAEVPDRAVTALENAGQQAARSFAHRETLAFYGAAVELDAEDPSPPERRGPWAMAMGTACSHLGRTQEGLEHLTEAVALLGRPLPSNGLTLGLGVLQESAIATWRRWFGSPSPRSEGRDAALSVVNSLAELGLLAYYQSNVLLALYASLRALNLAESFGPSPELARMKAAFAHLTITLPLHGASESYSTEAIATAEAFDDGLSTARVHQYRGALLIAYGRWDEVQPHADVAKATSQAIGHARGVEEAINMEVYVAMARGRYEQVFRKAEEMARSARWREDEQVVFWSQIHRSEAQWHQGDHTAAWQTLRSMDPAEQTDATILRRYRGLQVHVLLGLGRVEEARALAEEHLLPQERAASFIELRSFTALCELYLALWEAGDRGYAGSTRRAVKGLATFAHLFPQGRAALAYYQGRAQLAAGRTTKGVSRLQHSLAVAGEADEPYQRLLAHLALAPHDASIDHSAEAERLRATLQGLS